MQLLYFLCIATCNFGLLAASYPACGDNDGTSETAHNIDKHVERLLGFRNSEHGWLNTPEIVLGIQLANPASFHGENETASKLMEELEHSINNISVGRLALYIMATKSLCRDVTSFNGVNYVEKLRQKLTDEFSIGGLQQKSPHNGWYGFFLGLGAYCIASGTTPEAFLLHRALHAQNRDGSFGRAHSVDLTANAMLSLMCLQRRAEMSELKENQLLRANKKAADFLLTQIVLDRGDVWIGNKYSSPNAVLALKEYSNWMEHSWRCQLVLKSLDNLPAWDERESAIAQRLLALKGVSFLSILNDNYQCSNSDPDSTVIPPIVEFSKPGCSDVENEGNYFLHYLTMIDIQITIRTSRVHRGNQNEGAKVFTLRDVHKGRSLLEILTLAQCRGFMTFDSDTTSWGDFVTSVDGNKADSEKHEYWEIQSNGESIPVAVGQFVPAHADRITFKIKTW